jgi:hypothetical protein
MPQREQMNDGGFFAKIVSGELPEAPITKLLAWKFLERFHRSGNQSRSARSRGILESGGLHPWRNARGHVGRDVVARAGRNPGPGEFAPTLEIKVNFISPAKVGRVLGTGRIVSRGRSICFMKAQLHDEQGNLLATATATSKIGRQK